ncbi:pleckstrin homology domain-containing family M member 2 isoform X2 [Gouania willdenowi]|uniref:Pleckstrin homology domain-containing family M member 2 n=1 Tax=Gouania willdenowi TaxID=441366 RepID=A0A8C5ESW2_GOUWI|nr:pleckstrin homology domain-containing family M member 2 isoform X2 [Gouania willdenowi]
MDQLKVKDRILENISLSVKKLQSYFAACEDETPAIRNHDRVLQRLCEHLDHALLYGLQDISSGYWVLVLHFTRREAVRQIDELQHIATNLGRSRAWLYLALSESSLESYLRLFQENQGLLQKYYFKNALVCSHDHLTLFLTLVSGLEFIRFDLELDVPYLDVAPYMPEYYKPHNLLDFEERLPSSDSLSLHSFTSLTSTNLEWDDSAIAPSSEEGDLTDQASCPQSSGSDPQTVISETALLSVPVKEKESTRLSPPSPTLRHNPFNEESDTNTSTDVTPVHVANHHTTTFITIGDDAENTTNELEVIRLAKRRKASKKRRGKGSTDSSSSIQNSFTSEHMDSSILTPEDADCPNGAGFMDFESKSRRSTLGSEVVEEGIADVNGEHLRLPEMVDTSMDSVGQPLSDVMDRLNGALDREEAWGGAEGGEGNHRPCEPPAQQPFREDSGGKPPDPGTTDTPGSPLPNTPNFLQASPPPADFCCFAPNGPDSAATGGGHNDSAELSRSQTLSGSFKDEGEATASTRQESNMKEEDEGQETHNATRTASEMKQKQEEKESETEPCHPAEFKVDNNHLLLLMIHVFRENEEQLFKMVRMSTGHMEGDLQPLFLLLTDCYIYLLRKGAAEKPYTLEDAVSYNELDYLSVGLDQQTVTIVCTNRRRKFLLDTADASLTCWFLSVLKSAMVKGCREPPYPSVLTDATMEKLALTKFVSQESHCEVSEVSIHLYSLVHWEDPMDVVLSPQGGPQSSTGLSSTREGTLQYRAGTTYLGKELWKGCYLVLSNGILYLYAERTDVTPLQSVTMGGEFCGGCRRFSNTERPHAFQVILTERPPLVLCANNEQDMADWMQLLCQSVSKGVIPQGVAPNPCIPCCLVVTSEKLLTCHQDCQTSFFRSLGSVDICDVIAVCLEADKQYCVIEFAEDRNHFLPPWVLYFSGCEARDHLLKALGHAWRSIYQVDLPHREICERLVQKRCSEALALIRSVWQRADSLARGRAQREPWC